MRLIFQLEAIFSKKNLYSDMKLPKEGTDGLPKDGFDWITVKVIFKG